MCPGMSAAAATNFAALLTTASGQGRSTSPTSRRVVVGRRSTGSEPNSQVDDLGIAADR